MYGYWVFVHKMAQILQESVFDDIRTAKLHLLIIEKSTDLTGTEHVFNNACQIYQKDKKTVFLHQ